MNKKTLFIIGLQTLLIIALFWVLVFYGKDEYEAATKENNEETIATSSMVTNENGAATVTLTSGALQQSGITTSPLQAATHEGAVSAFGTVVSMDGLLELRTRYLTTLAETEVARSAIANSRQEFERMRTLNQDNRNVSDRAVSLAEAAWKADQARLHAGELSASALKDSMRQQWGEALAGMACQPTNAMFQRLLQRQESLVQITLPIDAALPESHSTLMIETPGGQKAIEAKFLSPAPQAENTIQGKTFFYLAPSAQLRAGMRVTANLSEPGRAQPGVIVPANAVVWYSNQPWAYRKLGAGKFVRTPIKTDVEVEGGWFNAGTLNPGEAVVTTGAQLLLSEEFKYQIKNENED